MTWRRPEEPRQPRPVTPPHLKRYGWYRLYNDFTRHPKWRVIAKATGLPLCEVLAVAQDIMRAANVGRPRGSLSEFSLTETAAALDLPGDRVTRIYAALIDHGWIDQDFLVTWDERQPDREDPTNKERQQRFRDKRKAEREAMRNGVTLPTVTRHGAGVMQPVTRHGESVTERDASRSNDAKTVTPVTDGGVTQTVTRHGASRAKDPTTAERSRRYRQKRKAKVEPVTRNAVTSVTSRPDQTRSDQAVDSNQSVNWGEKAADWLAGQGLREVMACGHLLTMQAQIRIGRWRAAMGDDEALRNIIHGAAALAVEGRFLSLVGQEVARYVRERDTTGTLRLGPLGPVRAGRQK